jgi:intein/homing endonuclease
MKIIKNIVYCIDNKLIITMGRKQKHNYALIEQKHKEGIPLKNLSREYNIPLSSIYSWFQRNNIEYNKSIIPRHQGYWVNDNYLNCIDSEDKAYFLGFMFSDGWVSSTTIGMKLNIKDIEILSEMFSFFSKGYKINLKGKVCGLTISSQKLSDDLKNLGCVENKSQVNFSVPLIPKNLIPHFIRGYFDGDGSIGIRRERPNQRQINICSVNKKFLLEVQEILLQENITTHISEEKRTGKLLKMPNDTYSDKCKNMFRLNFLTHENRLKFFEYMYKKCSIKLKRKYVLYKEYYDNTVLTLESKNSKAVQRIGDETLINYNLLNKTSFYRNSDLYNDKIIKLFNQGICEYQIHKQVKISRSVISRVIKEYNSPKSAQQPIVKQVENIC